MHGRTVQMANASGNVLAQNFLRYFCLAILTLQTTVTVLSMRFSRKPDPSGGELYIGTTVVLVAELIKFGLCLLLLLWQKSCSLEQTCRVLSSEVFYKPYETAKLVIPSTLYTIQNNLVILALSYLDAATFQVTYQLKILTTAFFSVVLLRRDLRPMHWISLIMLTLGIILVQLPTSTEAITTSVDGAYRILGLVTVIASSFSSGFAGVYYEKLLKESSQPSVVLRNIQLSIFSVLFGALGVLVSDRDKVSRRGFFDGYTSVVWLVISLQASGGLLVAAVIKYADNILKGFATSVSIILSCLCSYVVFGDLEITPQFVFGTATVIGATFLYGIQPAAKVDTKTSANDRFITQRASLSAV